MKSPCSKPCSPRPLALLPTALAAVTSLLLAAPGVMGQDTQTINFDTTANWIQDGSTAFTSYASHGYSEASWQFTGTNVLRNGTATQDGVSGALGSYSFRLRDDATSLLATYTGAMTVTAFGFDVRRWDESPAPNYSVEYSINGGASYVSTGITINNTFLNDSSEWKPLSFTLPSPATVAANQFLVRIARTGGERIMIDNFNWTSVPAEDETDPEIVSRIPAINSTVAPTNTRLSIAFNEAIAVGASGSVVIKKSSDASVVETISVPGPQVTVQGVTAIIRPSVVLAVSTGYYVEMTAGTFVDAASNPAQAISGNSAWNFTTRSAPQIIISQYYEGLTAADRFIELKNLTGAPINLDGYRLTTWSDTALSDNEGWKTGTNTTDLVTNLTGTIPASGYFLVSAPNSTTPSYAANNFDQSANGGATAFDGDDSIVLYTSGTGFGLELIEDAFPVSASQAQDTSVYRLNEAQTGYDFTPGSSFLDFEAVWSTRSLSDVNNAPTSDPWYLSASKPPKTLSLEFAQASIQENGGTTTATVTRTGNTGQAATVNITANLNGVLTFVSSIEIPINQAAAVFTVSAVDNPWLNGDVPVMLTVGSTGYSPVSSLLTVLDDPSDPVLPVVINEVDADTPGTDLLEFIELYNTSSEEVSLAGVTLVLYNGGEGTLEESYLAINLSGFSVPGNGFFVVGNSAVSSAQIVFANNTLQNGPDAVALYVGDVSRFPAGTIASAAPGYLVDALVYGRTDHTTASTLLNALTPGEAQVSEGNSTTAPNNSLARVPDGGARFASGLYVSQTPTPGATNVLPVGGYFTWAQANAGGQGPELDSDNDGVPNGVEFFMNAPAGFTANPSVVSGAVSWPNGGKLLPGQYGGKFVVQTSTNLIGWTNVPPADPNLANLAGSLTYTLPTGAGPFFVRLQVTP